MNLRPFCDFSNPPETKPDEQMKLEIGKTVKRLSSDYTSGRIGRVIEIDNLKPRARVHWVTTSQGGEMNLRTWVRFSDLEYLY